MEMKEMGYPCRSSSDPRNISGDKTVPSCSWPATPPSQTKPKATANQRGNINKNNMPIYA